MIYNFKTLNNGDTLLLTPYSANAIVFINLINFEIINIEEFYKDEYNLDSWADNVYK